MKILVLLLLVSCASTKKEPIPGYSGEKLNNILPKIEGKNRYQAVQILGNPAAAGRCKLLCGPKDVYRLIYPTRDMDRFYLDITANTDEKIDCVIFDFLPDPKTRKFIFRKKNHRIAKNCNNNDGEIHFLNTYKMPEKDEQSKR